MRIDRNAVIPLRRAVDRFLQTLQPGFIQPGDLPADPDEDELRATVELLCEHGLPVTDRALSLSEDEADRNRLLRGYLVHEGWERLDVVRRRPGV